MSRFKSESYVLIGAEDPQSGHIFAIRDYYGDGPESLTGVVLAEEVKRTDRVVELISMGDAKGFYGLRNPNTKFLSRDLGKPMSRHSFESREDFLDQLNSAKVSDVYLWDGDRWLFASERYIVPPKNRKLKALTDKQGRLVQPFRKIARSQDD